MNFVGILFMIVFSFFSYLSILLSNSHVNIDVNTQIEIVSFIHFSFSTKFVVDFSFSLSLVNRGLINLSIQT